MTVAWGQNAAYGMSPRLLPEASFHLDTLGELGLGPDEPKSATKPGKHMALDGIDVFEFVERFRCVYLIPDR